MLGATGTIGRATREALLRRGHEVVCFARASSAVHADQPGASEWRFGDVTDLHSLQRDGFRGEQFDVLLSCMASRTGSAKDAWGIDYQAHVNALECAQIAGVTHIVLLSAICVQKPLLAFQHAKLAFEDVLIKSGVDYSIVRPTAFFKSLSGQIERVQNGKSFLLFGDGNLTACKPISDHDLAAYLAESVDLPSSTQQHSARWWAGPSDHPAPTGRTVVFPVGERTALSARAGGYDGCDHCYLGVRGPRRSQSCYQS